MKKPLTFFSYLLTIVLGTVLFVLAMTSCRSTAHIVGSGKVFNASTGGLTYVNGLFEYISTSSDAETSITTDDGDSFANPTAAITGIRTIRFRTGTKSQEWSAWPDDAATRGEAPKLPEGDAVPFESEKTSKNTFTPTDNADTFLCNGNCDYSDLTSHDSISYQSSIVVALSGYDCSAIHPDSGETYAESLKDFAHILETYAAAGLTTTRVRIKSVTVADKKVTNLTYAFIEDDGRITETQCPNCTPWELPEMLEESAEQ